MALDRDNRDGVLVLTLNEPQRRNPLTQAIKDGLFQALTSARTDEAVRAVVLTGAGGNFCAGGDLATLGTETVAGARERMMRSGDLIRRMVRYPKPLYAAVEGWAAGAGLSIALACDGIVAGEGARFLASFVRVGLIPDLGMLGSLPARIGPAPARRMMLSAEPMDAAAAQAAGLVDEVTAEGAALDRAVELARAAAARAPLPQAHVKDFLARAVDEALDYEALIQPLLLASQDAAEGRAAFFDKREPQFKGM
ncbi:enoyl-CoA hydratase/isomerase family protein [Paracoccus sp. (in: a-proteobacteria)]|uniref:enoyl-CoA hydratase/isomerase family protein n=1 Tax=Paracoccus sp. TaxID=267 RepID=UPI0026E1120E|nr:enoyl-CoA hydratase-related protein [Paracoccus sp. (in: a-proteobacteria)]MDO5371683.1 enoyl-CoA hydratase-related protein [Paracoccus sp. (in: a-proteobacteria)]